MSLINGLGDARLQVRLRFYIRVLGEEIRHKGHLEQGRDMRFHPIMSLG
jgi:hypothetical protein